MKEEIISNLDNPKELEKLYRSNKIAFKKEFNLLYQDIQTNQTAQIWNERLNFDHEEISWGSGNELLVVIVLSIIAGIIAKIPVFTGIDSVNYYSKNIAFIVFPILSFYFAWRQKNQTRNNIIAIFAILASILFINILPNNSKSDTLLLVCIHMPLFIWAVLGFTFIGDKLNDSQRRLDFLRYNGDLMVMTIIILLAGIILTAISLGLFALIGADIYEFYFNYIVVGGLAASPIVGTYLIQTNPQLVNKVSPVIAKIFTPLVLLTLVAYLIAIIGIGKDPYKDRDFLLLFNLLLFSVMAIILFAITGTSKNSKNTIGTWLLFLLALVTIIVNGIALSAIIFRISEWGISPNRLAVLGGNILILINLFIVTRELFVAIRNESDINTVEISIAKFLPIYTIWTIIVTFVFPLVFNFK